jgi:transcriptional regulator with XRE-family HTH domain
VPTAERTAGPSYPLYPALEAALAAGPMDAERLARVLGWSDEYLDAFRNGEVRPAPEIEQRIAAAMDVPGDELFVIDPGVAYLISTAVEQGEGEYVTDLASYRRLRAILQTDEAA